MKRTFLKRMISATAAAVLSLTAVPLNELSPVISDLSAIIAHAAVEPRRAILSYNDLTDFATYSLEYSASPDLYCEDIITLNLNTGLMNTIPSNFVSLGTKDCPFNGKIYINQTYGESWWFETEKPLFDYITDSAVINYSDSEHNTQAIPIELRRKENSAIKPLFANHVKAGGETKATWSIKSAVQRQEVGEGLTNILVCNNSGLIGEMCEGASVTVEYENNAVEGDSRVDVSGSGDIGLICGTMQKDSRINLTLTGYNTGCLVKSESSAENSVTGNAGGLVGSMDSGSVLKINDTYTPSSSRRIIAENGYAGGLVGYCNGGKIEFPEMESGGTAVYSQIRGTIEGTSGAGGLYGYYSNYVEDDTAQPVTIKMENYDVNCTVKSATAGGLIGVLAGTADFTVDGSSEEAKEITVTGDAVSNFGGIAGTYQTSTLKNSFCVNTVTANTAAAFTGTSYYGGVCGQITGEQAAYLQVSGFTHKSDSGFADATAFGGAVGNAGDKGSMLDIGTITVETGSDSNGTAFVGGGIVGVLTDGVLRLSGTTNMQKAPASAGQTNGQLVGIRKDSLVYAVGSGNANDTGWVFNRSNTDVEADDIGTWGTVLRTDTTYLPAATLESKNGTNSGVLDFHTTNHTVTVAKAVTEMKSASDYTKTALNMQLNSVNKGALQFTAEGLNKSTLLGTDLSFSGTVNLSGTGNIGLMRDDYKDNDNEIGLYTKTISGGTVSLAIGERYGVYTGSNPVGRGAIMAHRYNGLLARTGAVSRKETVDGEEVTTYTPATVSGITIGGTVNVNSKQTSCFVGGAVASAENGITLTSVVAQETVNFHGIDVSDNSKLVVGGMVGDVASGSTADVTVTNGVANAKLYLTGSIGSSEDGKMRHSVGGVIGRISSGSAFDIDVNGTTVGTTITTTGVSAGDISASGLIADIVSGTTREMTLTGVTVSGTSITNSATSHASGLLGHRWLNTDVEFTEKNGVIVSGTNTLSTQADYAAGLVQRATGHWTVPEKGISITGVSIANATNSLGLLVHDGYYSDDGLYLELTHKNSYDLRSGLSIPATTTYDELVAVTGSDILSNRKNGIISITTDGDLSMNGTSCNTYQNKYNKNNLSNSKSRYYYNLTSIKSTLTSTEEGVTPKDGEKLLFWSLNRYAATNINSNFPSTLTKITGTFDLEHISYYPIDIGTATEIGDATFQFYNDKIELSEAGSGNSDLSTSTPTSTGVRTTRGASQHYLMHSGVFRNVSSTLTTSGNIHFKGTIGTNSTYSGALINGTLSGTLSTSAEKEIVLEGLTLSDSSYYLLINKMTTNSKLTLSGVRTGGGKNFSNVSMPTTGDNAETAYAEGATVASSLIGEVSGNGIQIAFTRMKLDSRTTAGSPADWSAQYGTTKSIFSDATFLNKFAVDNNSTGTYEFGEALDWTGGTHNANVTYGMEIKTSVEYKNKQQKYLDQLNFVDPETAPSSARTAVYSFDSGFLPYVKESTGIPDADDPSKSKYSTRELKVNVRIQGLTEGCGTYNHPYEITTGSQLTNVATAINKTGYPDSLRLPIIQGSNYASAITTHWCTTKNSSCAEFTYDKTTNPDNKVFTYTENGTIYTWTEDQVSLYLASAYYIVKNDISITGTYPGLGASPANDTTGKYAFRGVIIGSSSDGSVKISMSIPKTQGISGNTNFENTSGLITMSNGCVVKNLTIEVTPYASDKYNYKSNGNQAYGYDEKFPNYGAVINKIMGGDNIIDNVSVNLIGSFKVVNSSDYKATVGGYVGCVVNGGLIFRNVDDSKLTTTTITTTNNVETKTSKQGFKVIKVNGNGAQQEVKIGTNVICSSTVEGSLTDDDDLIHIHVNPFVGRVINGYAIRETDSYGFSEDGKTYGDGETRANAVKVTMHNTRKNYSIPDIDTTMNYQNDAANGTSNVLTFSQSTTDGSYDTITVPNSQALYIMSIIAQSGSGCATGENNNYAYNISYCGGDSRSYSSVKVNNAVVDNNKATHWANYSAIGENTKGDDYNLSKNDTINNRKAVPYLIYKYTSAYTSGTTAYYPARTLTKRTFYVNLVGGTTYYLPDCFRGIGFLGSNELEDNMKVFGFNGNSSNNSETIIDVNAEFFTHKRGDDPYFSQVNNTEITSGIALFNSLKQRSSTGFDRKYEKESKYQITNFTLQGYMSAHHVYATNYKAQSL